MSYSNPFFKTPKQTILNVPNIKRVLFTSDLKKETCNTSTDFFPYSKDINVESGFNKPINEKCPVITGTPSGTNALWNNMTRRKSIVKDY